MSSICYHAFTYITDWHLVHLYATILPSWHIPVQFNLPLREDLICTLLVNPGKQNQQYIRVQSGCGSHEQWCLLLLRTEFDPTSESESSISKSSVQYLRKSQTHQPFINLPQIDVNSQLSTECQVPKKRTMGEREGIVVYKRTYLPSHIKTWLPIDLLLVHAKWLGVN